MLNYDSPDLGGQIKRARMKLGLSQTAFAERAGLSGGYLSTIESGNRKPSLKALSSIRKELNGSLSSDEEETLEVLIQKIVDMGFDVSVSRHA